MKNIIQFLQEVKVELTKVVWPKFDEFIGSTIVVLFLIGILAVFLGGIDLGFSRLDHYIFRWYGL